MNVNELIQVAAENHRTGKLQQAEKIYKQILNEYPNNVDALHFLGVLHYQRNNYDSAIEYIKKALYFETSNPFMYYNFGNALREKGRLDEAISS